MCDTTIELFKYNKLYTTIDKYPIKDFTIYGERHSGTNWLESSISRSFNIPITWKYGHKHFFGFTDWRTLNSAHNTLFIGIVRNIYSWINGMVKIPYHLESSNVLDIKPWKSIKPRLKIHDKNWYTKDFYTDIFDMRKHKMEFLYDFMPHLVDNYIFIRYEDYIRHHDVILTTIKEIYGFDSISKKTPTPDKTKLSIGTMRRHDYMHRINNSFIWDYVENRVGYRKINNITDQNYLL